MRLVTWLYRTLFCIPGTKALRIIVTLSITICWMFDALGQSQLEKVKFTRMAETLSSKRISSILQDSRGFLWVGTEDGLNRFDGYDVTVFRSNPEDSSSLLKNVILRLFEDSRGILWVSTSSGGLHVYDRQMATFDRLRTYSFDCEVTSFHEDDTSIWFGGIKHGNAFVDQMNKRTSNIQSHELFASRNPVHAIIPASPHEFWLGVRGTGLFLWDLTDGTIQQKGPSNDLLQMLMDNENRIWIAGRNGLMKYDPDTNESITFTTLTNPALPTNDVLEVCLDGNELWIGTENGGLCRLNTASNELSTFRSIKYDIESLPDNSIHALHKDRQGRIWIGTYSNGLAVVDRFRENFAEVDIALENDIVNAVLMDSRNRLWVGTEDGLVVKSNGQTKQYKHTADKGSLQANPVLALYEDKQKRIWIGTWGGGLNLYDEAHDNFIHYMPDKTRKESLSNPNVFSIGQSAKTQHILLATFDGLNVLTNVAVGSFEHIHEEQFEFNNYVRSIYEDSKGEIWVGTLEELLRYDPNQKKLIRFETTTNLDSIKVGGLCNTIFEDSRGKLWVGTQKGLHLIVNDKFVRRYTTDDGLRNNIIQSILEDNHGNLWLGTTSGLSRFNPSTDEFRNYDVTDGLPSNDFKPNACFKNENGQFFFGGKGICVFRPDSLRDNPFKPEVFITELQIMNESVEPGDRTGILTRQISETTEITIPPRYKFFSLKYVGLNFTSSAKNQYAYKLDGFHTDWNYVGNQRSVMFTNLDPGTYTFNVIASNNDNLWNTKGTSLIIHILPPWWDTWWAKLTGASLLLGIIVLAYRIRISNIGRINKLLELQVKKRTEELAHQNEELKRTQEEITAQSETLSSQNLELQIARQTIETQNKEITKRNETLEAEVQERTHDLVEYNQQLEQFAFISAHNLRAPVARILGLGHLLDMSNSEDDAKLITSKLVFTTRELDSVVKDLSKVLEMRRNTTMVIEAIDLEKELRIIKTNMLKEIQETNTTIIEDFTKGPIVNTVRSALDTILVNLVSNAIKYRHPERPPVIRITTEQNSNSFHLIVQDNGLGMDMAFCREKLFTLYGRFHTHCEGKGMGLYLVKTQLTLIGGKVEVVSELQRGTTFHISLKSS